MIELIQRTTLVQTKEEGLIKEDNEARIKNH